MVRLLILRHAKASSPQGMMDIDRPLAARGRNAAARMGRYLHEEGLIPDLALVSPSHRTRETWYLVQPALGTIKVSYEPAVYAAPAPQLLALLHEIAVQTPKILLVGHNPGCEDLAQLLIGEGDEAAVDRMNEKFPTAALAVIDFDVESWRGVRINGGRLERFVTPADLDTGEDD